MFISSTSNERIKKYASLKQKKYRDSTSTFLVEGEDLVNAALEKNCVLTILTSNEKYASGKAEVIYTTQEIIDKLSSTKTPQDIVAVCKKIKNDKLSDKVIILDGIQDPSNAGAIARSCLAFGYNTMILSSDCVDIYNDKFLRASKGAIFKLNVLVDELKNVYSKLHKDGYHIVATSLEKSLPLSKIEKKDKLAIVVGNEGNGISSLSKKEADQIVRIDQSSDMESLNVGVAASIMMYELSIYKK